MTATVTATVLCNPVNCEAVMYIIETAEYITPLFHYLELQRSLICH